MAKKFLLLPWIVEKLLLVVVIVDVPYYLDNLWKREPESPLLRRPIKDNFLMFYVISE